MLRTLRKIMNSGIAIGATEMDIMWHNRELLIFCLIGHWFHGRLFFKRVVFVFHFIHFWWKQKYERNDDITCIHTHTTKFLFCFKHFFSVSKEKKQIISFQFINKKRNEQFLSKYGIITFFAKISYCARKLRGGKMWIHFR